MIYYKSLLFRPRVLDQLWHDQFRDDYWDEAWRLCRASADWDIAAYYMGHEL